MLGRHSPRRPRQIRLPARRQRRRAHTPRNPLHRVSRCSTTCRPGRITVMERVVGIGGYFLRAADPAALSTWYRESLGLDADENGVWHQEAGLTVFAPFEADTDYFGSRSQHTM